MIFASCRKSNLTTEMVPLHFFTNNGLGTTLRKDNEATIKDLEAKAKVNPHACILIHGYNNDGDAAIKAYHKIIAHRQPEHKDLFFIGFLWPSAGNIFSYFGDRSRAVSAGNHLDTLVNILFAAGFETVSFQGHSMGNFVIAKYFQKWHTSEKNIHRWVGLAADLNQWRLKEKWLYGKNSDKVDKAIFFYSKNDLVLSIPAMLAIPTLRVGFRGLPQWSVPWNFEDEDSRLYSDSKVRHRDYKDLAELQQSTFDYMLD